MSALSRNTKKRLLAYGIILAAIAVFCVVCLPGLGRRIRNPAGPPELAFDGPSDQLAQTVIVPTLDTPMPAGKNVIWCASFQLAWNELRDQVVREPIRIANAEGLDTRLNDAKSSKNDLDGESYFATAGAVADGVLDKIRHDMARHFPEAPRPEIDASQKALVAYAYLAARVKFRIPFFDTEDEVSFGGVPVTAFGIAKKHEYAYDKLREQIEVLYVEPYAGDRDPEDTEFVIDPCKHSAPYQIILAHIPPKETLAATLEDLDSKLAGYGDSDYEHEFTPRDELLVPNIAARIEHHFSELEGEDKALLNKGFEGYWMALASQVIEFRLDRSGAELRSEAAFVCKPNKRYFYYSGPFLIVMRKRGAEEPFFVMWVGNAELLCKP